MVAKKIQISSQYPSAKYNPHHLDNLDFSFVFVFNPLIY